MVATLWQAPTGEFEGRVPAQIIQIISIRVAAGNCEDPSTQNVCHCVRDQIWVAVVRDDRGQRIDQTKPLVGAGSNKTPPSELIRPPSNAAVTFFWQMLGKENARSVSSSLAGMADSVRTLRLASVPNLYAIPEVCTMPVSESLPCGE